MIKAETETAKRKQVVRFLEEWSSVSWERDLTILGITAAPKPAALVEVSPAGSSSSRFIMYEGQRYGAVEVMNIKPETGTGTNVQLKLGAAGAGYLTTPKDSFRLVNADIDLILSLYAGLKGRTLLRSPRLPVVAISIETASTNLAEATQVIETALDKKGIATILDGEKFLMIVPAAEVAAVKSASRAIKSSTRKGDGSEPVPVGAINFQDADLIQVAQIYAAFIGCKLDPTERFPRPTLSIKFKNQTSLSKDEVLYALETLLRWQSVNVVRVTDGLVKLVQE